MGEAMTAVRIKCPVRRKETVSLRATVAKLVAQRGEATIDDLAPLLPDYSRHQIMQAMQNARYAGMLDCDGPKWGGRYGRMPGTYRPADPGKPARAAASSVWGWAQSMERQAA